MRRVLYAVVRCPNKTETRLSLHSSRHKIFARATINDRREGKKLNFEPFKSDIQTHTDSRLHNEKISGLREPTIIMWFAVIVYPISCTYLCPWEEFRRFIFVASCLQKREVKRGADTSEKWLIAKRWLSARDHMEHGSISISDC